MAINRLKCFISYSHKDNSFFKKFLVHLQCVERTIDTENWYDGKIQVGENIDDAISANLRNSDVIFLLISPDYINSYYCYEKELGEAIKRHEEGKCKVIPVILKEYPRGEYPFSKLKFVPTDGRAVANFQSYDKGFSDAFKGIVNLLENLSTASSKKTPQKPKKEKAITSAKYIFIKKGKPTSEVFTQELFDSVVAYSSKLTRFILEMNMLLSQSISRFKEEAGNSAPHKYKRYQRNMEDYLLQCSGYIQQFFPKFDNTCVHFRKKSGSVYKDFFEMGYTKNNLAKDPIAAENGMIECSKTNECPIIKLYNSSLHKCSHPDEKVSRNYITCALNTISQKYHIDLSMCISVVGSNISNENNIFLAMSIMRFDLVIENYLCQYIDACRKIDSRYDVDQIFKV